MRKVYTIIFSLFLVFTSARADEGELLSLYGLKGYAYVYSPLVSEGTHFQIGALYSLYHKSNLTCRDGYIWYVPVSLTLGDGDWWELSVAGQWEYWKNTDFDIDESGFGDVFIGGKLHVLSQARDDRLDLSLMPYILLPTGEHDKWIGDLYLFNPTNEDDYSYGLNLLIGRRLGKAYTSLNIGVNHVDTDLGFIQNKTYILGVAIEYPVSDKVDIYAEYLDAENKNELQTSVGHPCYDSHVEDNIRELGIGVMWRRDKYGLKLHVSHGFTNTTADLRVGFSLSLAFGD